MVGKEMKESFWNFIMILFILAFYLVVGVLMVISVLARFLISGPLLIASGLVIFLIIRYG